MSRGIILPTIALLIAAAAAGLADEGSHTVLLGLAAGPAWDSEAGEDAEVVARILASGAYGYRARLGRSGFAAASASIDALIEDASSLEIRPALNLESRLPAGRGELDGILGARASFLGEEPYVFTTGRTGYRFGGERLQPAAWLVGSLEVEPEAGDDSVGGGLRVGLLGDRSVRLGVDVIAEGIVQSWYETDVYTDAGVASGDKRRDVVTDLQIKLGGLAGYFLEWEAGIEGAGRFSTANRLLESGAVDSDSESRVSGRVFAAAKWNPHRRLAAQLALSAQRSWYLGRDALTDTGAATDDLLRTLDLAASLRIDWLPGASTYLVLEGGVNGVLANDTAEQSWSAELRLGVEIAL